ncbi:MAG: hypothetical protein H0U76_30205 [Ktedonobacteraceae bacterium]|nr:hypothetical protein [Ktedonobacteraceae bacterium]
MLDQRRSVLLLQTRSAFLAHPEVQQGIAEAHLHFLDSYEPEPLSEAEMIEVVETNVSRSVTQNNQELCHLLGWDASASSYLRHLGSVLGMVNEGLRYTQYP